MPSTVLQRLRDRFPRLGFYNCFGQSELCPLCTVLRPEEHDLRPTSCGRPVFHTEESFADGWFRSGDQVTRDSMGFIEVVDRIKDVINTGGVLVAPREIEDCLYRLPEVAEVAMLGLPDERLADYKVPKRVEFVAELPRNQAGKLLKRELRAQRTAPSD